MAGLFAQSAGAHYRIDTIYGEDDRLDLHEVTDARWASLSASTVALVKVADVDTSAKDGTATLIGAPLREEYNLCSDERYGDQPTAAFCSGSLVGPDLVLTAGHCIRDLSSCQGTRFVFDFAVHARGEDGTSNRVPASGVYGCAAIVSRKLDGRGADYALIRLDRTVEDRGHLEINRDGEPAVNTPLVMVGHPSGLPVKIAGGARVRNDQTAGYFVATTDSFGGNSGSAVFNARTGLIEGVLVRGDQDYVTDSARGCKRPYRCGEDECRGEDVTRVSEVRSFVP